MISEAKKIFAAFLGLLVIIVVLILGKNFGQGLRESFLTPNFSDKITLLEKTPYKADVLEDVLKKATWIQKPGFWRLEDPISGKIIIYKNEGSKVYIVDPILKNVQVQEENLSKYTAKSPEGIAKNYLTATWRKTSQNIWEGKTKNNSNVRTEFDPSSGLLTKITVIDQKGQLLKTFEFQYKNVNNIDNSLFDPFSLIQKPITPTPVSSDIKSIPSTGPEQNMLLLIFAALPIGLIVKKIVA